jgi:LAO/AO transport system kinase
VSRHSIEYYRKGIEGKDKVVLSQAVTLVESSLKKDVDLGIELIEQLKSKVNSIRLGISGVPGVGKSTFIEAFGSCLVDKGHKVAVLAVDPSSQITGGSILGDKTRMETLSRNPSAFIRPSPSKLTLGGVADRTRETILLCESAGYDVIIIETVGVGQSETKVHGMVDFFLLLMLAGAGDELQGIKKGIMEIADGVVINKADGDNIKNVNRARGEYTNALHMFAPNESNWQPKVLPCSSIEKTGLEEIWKMILSYQEEMLESGYFNQNRKHQNVTWFNDRLHKSILDKVLENPELKTQLDKLKAKISKGKLNPNTALNKLMESIFPKT